MLEHTVQLGALLCAAVVLNLCKNALNYKAQLLQVQVVFINV